ncbi:MAG: zf-HC2 domain-containing protein [Actinomycetota bacterium]|jgi:anti-sigma factor RsiW|nr:zf-HC2 domain-containing protein [Actinomycetota bacterium]
MTPHLGDLTSAFADGELDATTASAVVAHVEQCPTCAAEVRASAQVRDLVRRLEPVEPLRPLVATVAAGPRRLAGLVAAAAAAVALVLLSNVEQPPRGTPEVASLVRVHSTSPVNVDPTSQLAPAAIPVSFGR